MARFRHKLIFSLLLWPVRLVLRLWLGFTRDKKRPPATPCIVLANHTTDFDPIFVGAAFGRQIYFVASEHILRSSFASRLLNFALAPIPRVKGSADTASVKAILRAFKMGASVCIFAEGERCWNGQTGPLHSTIARLVKATRATLVNYRIVGGYFTAPRWGTSYRRGRTRCELAGVYSPAEVAALSDTQLAEIISRDIYEDAELRQRTERLRYRGKKLAEKMEYAFYVCPKCLRMSTLHSSGDTFSCDCGLCVTVNAYGEISGAPFGTIADWDSWQTAYLCTIDFPEGHLIFADEGAELIQVGANHDHTETHIASGELRLFADKLTVGSFSAARSDIALMSLHGRKTLVFSIADRNYEIKWQEPVCARKYLTIFECLRGR